MSRITRESVRLAITVPLVVAGDGIGGTIAAAVALRARLEAGPLVGLQVLACPALGLEEALRRSGSKEPEDDLFLRHAATIREHLLDLKEDGSFRLNMDYFTFCTGLTMTGRRFDALFGANGRVRLVNGYGPTETTVCATMSDPLAGSEAPPIGSAIIGSQVWVLDERLELVPFGVVGELYVSGVSLARGYLKQLPTGIDVNGVTQVLDGAVTNANREWLNAEPQVYRTRASRHLGVRRTLLEAQARRLLLAQSVFHFDWQISVAP